MTTINNIPQSYQISKSEAQDTSNSNSTTTDGYNLLLASYLAMTSSVQDTSNVYLDTQVAILNDQNKKIAELSQFQQTPLEQKYASVSVKDLLLAWDPTTQSVSTGYKIPWSQCPSNPAEAAGWLVAQEIKKKQVSNAIKNMPAGIEISPTEWNAIKNMSPGSTAKVRVAATSAELQEWSTENMQKQKNYSYVVGQIIIDQQNGQVLSPTQTSALSAMQQFEDGFASIMSTITTIAKKLAGKG